ncbi:hypothetical protein JOF53_002557 [Crossiella equi]|uniref:Catalytic LigB subunit of aromatic ring-opening dioxygenase n=1 Tax=Crossiella equi TaxID=130796 RepID=A0ABS5AAS8_9PSEU|nr:hypothetical protein [Crossiella equi]MBP2473685.1 hypothetical protein [Crossiella equi]
MIVRVAFAPHPPLLVPELVTGAAAETDPLRQAALQAATTLAQATPDWLVLATDQAGPATLGPDSHGTFLGFGVDVRADLGAPEGEPDPRLPLPALVAGWLRAHAGARSVTAHLLAPDATPEQCLELGTALAAKPGDHGLLVLADSSARLTLRSPVPPDPRAPDFDAVVAGALAAGDPAPLAELDPELARELWAHGRAAYQAAAAATAGRAWTAELLHSACPYGVGYHVATWV